MRNAAEILSIARRQENSSFANIGFASVCGVCKCALCAWAVHYLVLIFCLLVANCLLISVFLHLAVTHLNIYLKTSKSVYIHPIWYLFFTFKKF